VTFRSPRYPGPMGETETTGPPDADDPTRILWAGAPASGGEPGRRTAAQRPSDIGRVPVGEAPRGRFGDAYEVLGEVGRGGMGSVYRARDIHAGRDVALKVVRSGGATALARFQREGEVMAGLDHPGIVRVHALGEVRGCPFLACELVPGARTLDEVVPDLDRRARVAAIRDAARALGHAHAKGVVHRDVKPGNLLVDGEGRLRVTDFGLALPLEAERLTATGAFMGTPHYMAPEQMTSERGQVGPPTDVWALGVLLYEVLTGELPFPGPSLTNLLTQVLQGPPSPPRVKDASIPAPLEAVCLKALARRSGDRYPDGDALAADLDRWLEGGAVAARPPRRGVGRPAALVAGGAALIGLVALLMPGSEEREYPPSQWPSPRDPAQLVGGVPEAAPPEPEPAWRADAPGWLERVPPGRRPPLPLPDGVAFGEAEGEYVNQADGSVLVWIPPGELVMGSADGDPDERPPRPVALTAGYFLGKHEVTWAQVTRFCYLTGRPLPAREIEGHPGSWTAGDRHPAFHVSWEDARAYCEWAGLRLPTEAEWEYAARGPESRTYPWGDHAPREPVANLADASAQALAGDEWVVVEGYDDGAGYLSPVGAYPLGASPFGCLDMAGNVWEWVADRYAPYPDVERAEDPRGPAEGGERVVRGGSWCFGLRDCRGANRASFRPESRLDYVGFRAARSP